MPRLLTLRSAAFAALSLCLNLTPAARLHAAADAATTPDDSDSDVVARLGDEQVTTADLRAAIANLDAQTQAAAERDPQTLSKLVRLILAQRLVLKEALDKKWDQNPAVTAALETVRNNAIAQTYLQSVSKPPDSYPSDTDLQTVYDANKTQLVVPRQFEVAQIFVKDPKGSDAATEAKAKAKLTSVRKALAKDDADFASIARADSDETTSAGKGGELGWLLETRIQPEIRSQLGSLSKGSITQPVKLDDGWHILKVIDVKEPYTPTLEEIRPALVQKMRAARTQQNSQQYLAKLLQDNPVQINELALSKIFKQP
jgi:parvulin-like peptidyl-prolyl isomerase